MLYMALCGEYVRFEKFGFSGCCGGRESRHQGSYYHFTMVLRILSLIGRVMRRTVRTAIPKTRLVKAVNNSRDIISGA
jgi:hypothetical protein